MRFVFVKVLVVACLLCVMNGLTDGQVTFSRDWNAGKRSLVDPSDCSSMLRTVSSMANSLLKNIHQLSYCDSKPIFHNLRSTNPDDDAGSIFSVNAATRM